MRDDVNLGRRNLEDFLEKLRRVLAHHNEAVGELCEFDHYAVLVGIWFTQHRMKGGHDRHAEIPQQFQDGAARWPTENSVFVLHAYGIFGGPAGSHILELLRNLRMPIVTTLHTVLREPNPDQHRVMVELAELSDRLVVMSQHSSQFLQDIFRVPAAKIDVIPHGVPNLAFVDPNFYKDRFGVGGKSVLLTFGLLSPNKGVETVIQALPRILARNNN